MSEREQAIQDASAALARLIKLVCPDCAGDSPLTCNVVDGNHYHIGAWCKASTIHEAMAHLDDVRDQFANPLFNPEEKPRAHWGFSL